MLTKWYSVRFANVPLSSYLVLHLEKRNRGHNSRKKFKRVHIVCFWLSTYRTFLTKTGHEIISSFKFKVVNSDDFRVEVQFTRCISQDAFILLRCAHMRTFFYRFLKFTHLSLNNNGREKCKIFKTLHKLCTPQVILIFSPIYKPCRIMLLDKSFISCFLPLSTLVWRRKHWRKLQLYKKLQFWH